ncbi:MAG: hypothetical protein HY909_16400 [Deltaproteobacteria bacterium]|nr:hypothetical protein [Deltaproteobacteria bacterium]
MRTPWRRPLATVGALAGALVLVPVWVPGQPVPPPAPAPAPGGRTFLGLSEDRILEVIRTGRIVSRQGVGSTSINLHLHLAAELDAAWKPRTTNHGERYRAEIAAFRLNRLLGLSRVPPAVSRSIPRSVLRLAADTTVVFERDGTARGAAIYWVPVLRDSMIDRPRDQERWTSWLRQGNTIPADQGARAEEISTLLVFDMLTGNWDRWSGGNVAMDATGHLLYRDNNGAFDEPFVEGLMHRSMAGLRRTQKFHRGVLDRARALTEASLRAEMALDPDRDHPPLTDPQVRSLLRRRDALVTYVDGLVARYGAQRVYVW